MKVRRLRRHFERFNVDVAELCQWWMTLRKQFGNPHQPESFGRLGDFLLEPSVEGVTAEGITRDRWRLAVFDALAGNSSEIQLENATLPDDLQQAITAAAQLSRNPTTAALFERLSKLEKPHRLVLLKSAAEWIVSRYQRGMINWLRNRAQWAQEKQEWEDQHPALTPDIRKRYNTIYQQLKQPDTEPRRPNPRICPFERIKGGKDNCIYAGQKGHGPLCWKFSQFLKPPGSTQPKVNQTFFVEATKTYLQARNRGDDPAQALDRIDPKSKSWFPAAWESYLATLGITEQTIRDHHKWPHCLRIGETYEKSTCEHNPHTELCQQYFKLAKESAKNLQPGDLKLEETYREWRKRFFKAPSKPEFRYPSCRDLPMPKVFGDGFHEIDLEQSVLRLRLDDMQQGQWLEFGFIPWPKRYQPSRQDVEITSAHVNFIGTRARVGFRFTVAHAHSRFACDQQRIDELRRQHPRQSNDEAFLKQARQCLLDAFTGDPQNELRILAIDLGASGACGSVYQGRQRLIDAALPIIKVHRLFDANPSKEDLEQRIPKLAPSPDDDALGLRHKHILWHLETLSKGIEELGKRRSQPDLPAGPRDHDFLGDKRHVRGMIRDWVRLNARQIVDMAEKHRCDLIVFESMRGVRLPGYEVMGDPDKKRKEGMLAFGKVRRKVTEKAVERGMRTVTVPYGRSSQVCSACGQWQCDTEQDQKRWKKDKKNKRFLCKHKDCPLHLVLPKDAKEKEQALKRALDSDINAARVLARVFWGDITLPTDQQVKAAEIAKASNPTKKTHHPRHKPLTPKPRRRQ